LVVSGFEAAAKAQAVADAILTKTRRMFKALGLGDYISTSVALLGNEHTFGPLAAARTREVVMTINVTHSNPRALGLFALEIAPAVTGMAPGLHEASTGGRAKPSPRICYVSCLIPKQHVPLQLCVGDAAPFASPDPHLPSSSPPAAVIDTKESPVDFKGQRLLTVPLIALCFGRSGDKGDSANIALIARQSRFFAFLKKTVTEAAVKAYLPHILRGVVKRYELPGISALNFVCTQCLGGGGAGSIQTDRQGKNFAQKLLFFPVAVPWEWVKGSPFATYYEAAGMAAAVPLAAERARL